jgi:hypothetical protein
MQTNFENDIPKDLALRAFDNVSHDPGGRGQRALADYKNTLEGDYAELLKQADTDEKRELLEKEFSRFRSGYSKRYTAWLHSASRCMSSFVTGPSNFPVDRARKYSRWEHNRSMALHEFRKRALASIVKTLHPELRPIMAGDGDAVERLRQKIREAEAFQKQMKEANKYYKRKGSLEGFEGPEWLLQKAASHLRFTHGEKPFPSFASTNTSANIRRMKQRLEAISRDRAKEKTTAQGETAKVEDCPAENRVRIFFPGKPAQEIRTHLKKSGFRWSPTIGAWQAYRNPWALETARKLAGVNG